MVQSSATRLNFMSRQPESIDLPVIHELEVSPLFNTQVIIRIVIPGRAVAEGGLPFEFGEDLAPCAVIVFYRMKNLSPALDHRSQLPCETHSSQISQGTRTSNDLITNDVTTCTGHLGSDMSVLRTRRLDKW